MMSVRTIGASAVSALTVGSILLGGATMGSTYGATMKTINETSKWMSVNRSNQTVTLKVIADDSNDNQGMNFDGHSQGAMKVEIPKGWTVRISFQNHSTMMPHSLMIVPYGQHTKVSGFTAAFQGSSSPQPTSGISMGITQSFRFKASKTGTFAMICAMPGHSAGGMWDTFVVSSSLKWPTVLVTGSTVPSGGAAGGW